MKPWACVPTMALLATASVAALEEEEAIKLVAFDPSSASPGR